MINFPNNPNINDYYIYNNKKWIYNGTSWVSANSIGAKNVIVEDNGDYYGSSDVEGALQEVGQILSTQTGVDKTYIHEQMAPLATWVVVHNLNKYPSVQVVNNFNEVVIGNVTFDSINQLTIYFSGSFSGKAYLN